MSRNVTKWYTVDIKRNNKIIAIIHVSAVSKQAAIGEARKQYLDHTLSFNVTEGML